MKEIFTNYLHQQGYKFDTEGRLIYPFTTKIQELSDLGHLVTTMSKNGYFTNTESFGNTFKEVLTAYLEDLEYGNIVEKLLEEYQGDFSKKDFSEYLDDIIIKLDLDIDLDHKPNLQDAYISLGALEVVEYNNMDEKIEIHPAEEDDSHFLDPLHTLLKTQNYKPKDLNDSIKVSKSSFLSNLRQLLTENDVTDTDLEVLIPLNLETYEDIYRLASTTTHNILVIPEGTKLLVANMVEGYKLPVELRLEDVIYLSKKTLVTKADLVLGKYDKPYHHSLKEVLKDDNLENPAVRFLNMQVKQIAIK